MALLPNHSRCSRHSPRIKSGGGFNQPVGDQDLQNVVPARSLPARRQALGPEPIELQVSPHARPTNRRPIAADDASEVRTDAAAPPRNRPPRPRNDPRETKPASGSRPPPRR